MSTDPPFEPGITPTVRPGPSGGARERNRIARTKALCEGSVELFLVRGLAPVTIEEITSSAGVSKGSFYRYFENKAQLVEAVMEPVRSATMAALDRGAQALDAARDQTQLMEAYQSIAGELVPIFLARPELVKLFLQERHGPTQPVRDPLVSLDREVTARAIEMTEIALRHGLLRDVDPRVSTRVVLGACYELLLALLRGDDIGDPVAAADGVVRMAVEGVRARG